MAKIVIAVLLIFVGVITWAHGMVLQDPNLITTPHPPWLGTGMSEYEFKKHLRAKAMPYKLVAASGIFAGASLLINVFKVKKKNDKGQLPGDGL